MHTLTEPQTWISLVTLTLLEIVLGIDNIVFIAILAGKLPEAQQPKARRLGKTIGIDNSIEQRGRARLQSDKPRKT